MLTTFQSNLLNIGRRAYRLPERIIKRLVRKNYYTARAYYYYQLRRLDSQYKELPLLVHQMGKVGSSSVTKSLEMAKIGRRIYHTHSLRPEIIEKYERKRRGYLGTDREGDLRHIWQYRYLREQIERGFLENGKKWKVVTLIRDPIARNISDFFENTEMLPSTSEQELRLRSVEYDFEIIIVNNGLDELIQLFFEKFPHDYPARFLDHEIKGVFNIDLYASDFPTSKGYKVYRGKKADVLLIRLENLNDCFTEAFKEFLNIDNLTLVSQNVGSQKDYADIYRMFKDTICFPESFLDTMYSSKFVQHFYSEAEINQFRAKWSRKPVV
ncbi:MAG: hypothetical protein JRI54_06930 [Deltaproteobacteria bacterium]|nr:hypothetical protein [Deltaproteobacteria bacterium]